jgi:hypothetical protein
MAVDPNTINPEGLNSSSGVVRINPDALWRKIIQALGGSFILCLIEP